MDHSIDAVTTVTSTELPRVREVSLSQPFEWLRRGARDMVRAPRISFGVGALIAAVGLLLTGAAWKATYIAPALLGGFLLVAPFIALALYAVSRQLEQGRAPDAGAAWTAWWPNAGSIALFGLVLVLAYIFWERMAAILFAFFDSGEVVQIANWPRQLLLSREFDGLLLAYLLGGGALAAVVFALGVVTAPLLLDRPADVITAALTSLRSCIRNPGPMLLWAALIAVLTAIGFATFMLGLVVIFPVLAHASWHAYRDLVEP
jgi:uncharacterized membrane protein